MPGWQARGCGRSRARASGWRRARAGRRRACATAGLRSARRLRAIGRTPRPRTGEAKAEVLEPTGQTGRLLAVWAREARRLAAQARRKARAASPLAGRRRPEGRAARILASVERRETLAERGEKLVEQTTKRLAGGPIKGPAGLPLRPGRASDRRGQTPLPDRVRLRRAVGGGRPGHQSRADADSSSRPPRCRANPGENELLPQTLAELQRLGLSPREVALDGGFQAKATEEALAPLAPQRISIAGRASPGSRRTQRRPARYRTGCQGRISHLKRRHGLRRSRLQGGQGERSWTGWAVFAYNAEAYGVYA